MPAGYMNNSIRSEFDHRRYSISPPNPNRFQLKTSNSLISEICYFDLKNTSQLRAIKKTALKKESVIIHFLAKNCIKTVSLKKAGSVVTLPFLRSEML
jgi:hypothetical protein